jgi:hypothetical protein
MEIEALRTSGSQIFLGSSVLINQAAPTRDPLIKRAMYLS